MDVHLHSYVHPLNICLAVNRLQGLCDKRQGLCDKCIPYGKREGNTLNVTIGTSAGPMRDQQLIFLITSLKLVDLH